MYHQGAFAGLMTRKGLSDLLHAAEHSSALRRELRNCSNHQDLLALAANHGFTIKLYDLQNEEKSQRIDDWFQTSKIDPIRK